jgi:hypothetical protein
MYFTARRGDAMVAQHHELRTPGRFSWQLEKILGVLRDLAVNSEMFISPWASGAVLTGGLLIVHLSSRSKIKE